METELYKIRRLISDTLRDMLTSSTTAGSHLTLQRALVRFEPALWPFAIDIPDWARTVAEHNPTSPHAHTIKMIETRSV